MPDQVPSLSPQEPQVPAESAEPIPTPPLPATSEPKPPSAAVPPAKKSRRWLMVLLIALLVIVTGVVGYELKHHRHSMVVATVATKKDIPLLTYGFYNNPLNVFYPSDASVNGPQEMNEQIFEGLVQFSDGTQIIPALAASWTNPNDSTWVFKLKPNTYYHDGNTVTAQDVVYTWQQLSKTQHLASFVTPTIKNVQAIDAQTVQITTSAPDPVLLNRLTSMWIIDSKAPASVQPWELGAGPYTVKSGTMPTENTIDLVAFSKWHGGHIYTKAINYIFYPDTGKAITDLKAGKIDLADGLTGMSVTQLKNAGLEVFAPAALYVDTINFNTKLASSPTTNPKIREAFDLTVDPAAVLKAYGVTGSPIDQTVPLQVPGYNPAIKRPAIDIAKAKQLVQEAGYPNGVTIDFGVGEPAKAVGTELTKELAPVGIALKLDIATDEGTFFNNINNGTYQAFYEGNGTSLDDASDVLSVWQKAPFYDNPTFDKQLDVANQTLKPKERLADLQQAVATLTDDNAYIPLFENNTTLGSKKGIVYPLNVYDNDINTYFANVYQQ
jgi:peptide/nickel transport system substrate-binding protein